jgi:hypothetical protein
MVSSPAAAHHQQKQTKKIRKPQHFSYARGCAASKQGGMGYDCLLVGVYDLDIYSHEKNGESHSWNQPL